MAPVVAGGTWVRHGCDAAGSGFGCGAGAGRAWGGCRHQRVSLGFSGFFRVSVGFHGGLQEFPGVTGYMQVLAGFGGFWRVGPGSRKSRIDAPSLTLFMNKAW